MERRYDSSTGPDASATLWSLNLAAPTDGQALALANAGLALTQDAILVTAADGRILGANDAALTLTEFDAAGIRALTMGELLEQAEQTEADDAGPPARTLVTARGRRLWVRVREASVSDDATGAAHRVLVLTDFSGRAVLEERVRFLAQRDPLTGLPNTTMLREHFATERADASARGRRLALLFINIDRFKSINGAFGRSAGDSYLQHAAEVLGESIRQGDAVARIGGDEFIAVISHLETVAEVSQVIDRIRQGFAAPFAVNRDSVTCTASIGVSLFPDDGGEFDDLARKADMAMHLARRGGADGVLFHTEQMNRDVELRRETERDLRRAIDNGEIFMRYQPQVELATGRVVGLEALVRWTRPGYGEISPGDFIPVAEESGLIVGLGQTIYRQVCEQARTWHDMGIAVPVAVNLSPVEIANGEVDSRILEIVEETGLPPELLTIEITESGLIDDTTRTQTIIANLRESGIGLSIDDFLTGYSNFAYIRQFNATHLKIDRSFVSGIHRRDEHLAIVRAAVQMAAALGIDTIAEGVETPEEAALLESIGCAIGQGYWFARPLIAKRVEEFLASGYCRAIPATSA